MQMLYLSAVHITILPLYWTLRLPIRSIVAMIRDLVISVIRPRHTKVLAQSYDLRAPSFLPVVHNKQVDMHETSMWEALTLRRHT